MTTIPAGTADAIDRRLIDPGYPAAGFVPDGRHRRTPSYAIRLELVVDAPTSAGACLEVLASLEPIACRVVELVVDDALDPALTR